MNFAQKVIQDFNEGKYDDKLSYIYATNLEKDILFQRQRYVKCINEFTQLFKTDDEFQIFSAPGRTEIGGNHTDHQHGNVLAASINLDVVAIARKNTSKKINLKSEGYPVDTINLESLEAVESEKEKSASLIRGVTYKFKEMGYDITGFDAYITSNVLQGSGLSSSAAYETAIGTIINGLFCNNEVSFVEIGKIGQFAENVYFGKPCGLMDQMASSVGGIITIDFEDTQKPVIKNVNFDFTKSGHSLCIIDTGADHADLTDEYASIPKEMAEISNYFGKKFLREVDENEFYEKLSDLGSKLNHRAILRAMHFFEDNKRVLKQVKALEDNDFNLFLQLVKQSGYSSYMYLQNIYSSSKPEKQHVSIALSLCDRLLGDKGAYRVHGGGFAGTIQAFVPNDMVDSFKKSMENVLGENMCHILSIRPIGGTEVKII